MSSYLLAKLENDLNVSVTLDRTLMFNNLKLTSTQLLNIFKDLGGMQIFPQLFPTKTKLLTQIMARSAKLFNKYFVSVSNSTTQSILVPTVKESNFLADIVILPSTVSEFLDNCKFSLSADPIPPFVYHVCAEVIAPLVCQT